MMRDLLTQYGAVTIPLSILFAPLLRDWVMRMERYRRQRLLRELTQTMYDRSICPEDLED